MDGALVPLDQLETSSVAGAVVLLPAAASTDFLLRLQSDALLQARVGAVLVESGAPLATLASRSLACSLVIFQWSAMI